jgi:hypothetical protein
MGSVEAVVYGAQEDDGILISACSKRAARRNSQPLGFFPDSALRVACD